MNYRVVSKRVQYQTDDGLVADTPEQAAQMVAAHQSNAPNVSHHQNWFFESDVFDESGKHLGKFHLDEQGHIVPPPASKPAPADAVAPSIATRPEKKPDLVVDKIAIGNVGKTEKK